MADRAVVTGGAGFIGSHLVDALLGRGDAVWVVDDLSNGRQERVDERASFHELDISDHRALLEFVEGHGPFDRWYHFAAQADLRVSVADPVFDGRVNVLGTVAVLDAARQDGAQVTFASTGGAIYGEVLPPTSEAAPERPVAPYGAAKLAAEKYVAQHARLNALPHAIMRFANVYGPRQDPYGEGGVVAIFGGCALEGRRAKVFGDGQQTRDYVYVGDVVDATIRAADVAAAGGDAELRGDGDLPVYNVGRGVETTVLELWDATVRAAATGADPGFDVEPARSGELQRSALDAARARRLLGAPVDTPLEEGLARTLAWLGTRARA